MKNNVISLKSGEAILCSEREIITTILGSCVAVTVFDKQNNRGGMVHYLLPNCDFGDCEQSQNELNFGDKAIIQILQKFKSSGSRLQDLVISIFGGCLSGGGAELQSDVIAVENVKLAESIANRFGIKILKQKTGFRGSLALRFDSSTGDCFVKLIPHSIPPVVSRRVKVLIVDDSSPMRKILKSTLERFPEIKIIGTAESANEAELIRARLHPDVMTLDIHMPDKDGVTYLSELMKKNPMPVIMISDISLKEASPVMKALELGAFDYVKKPALSEINEIGNQIKDLILEASESSLKKKLRQTAMSKKSITNHEIPKEFDLMLIGASTGGTEALRTVFSRLPSETPPILVVQHMPAVFTLAFAESLNRVSKIKVKEASQGDIIERNCAYVAPGGYQMSVKKDNQGILRLELTDDPPVNRFKPSVDYLFQSTVAYAKEFKIAAIILTGMGDDGARGLLNLKNSGAVTVAQSEETCIVYGMPKAAVERNAAQFVVDLEEISESLLSHHHLKNNLRTGS